MDESSYLKGSNAEFRFKYLIEKNKLGTISKTDKYTDIHKHIDLIWERNGRSYNIDVKAYSEKYDNNISLTLYSVYNKQIHEGFLFSKYTDLIAFERSTYFLIVNKTHLQYYLEKQYNICNAHKRVLELPIGFINIGSFEIRYIPKQELRNQNPKIVINIDLNVIEQLKEITHAKLYKQTPV